MSAMGPRKSGRGGCELLTALVAAVAVAAVCAAPAVTASLLAEGEAAALQFAAFKQQYGKAYATPEEEAHRLRVFRENMADAQAMNALNPHALFGVTQFSDLTHDEFEAQYANGAEYFETALRDAKPAIEVTGTAPPSVDWRSKGAVTPVKNQGDCGGCWAFAAIGAIESQTKIVGGELKRLSEQHLVSCDAGNGACIGGFVDWTFRYIVEQNNGIVYTEESYPYVSANKTVPPCDKRGRKVGAKVSGYRMLPKDENQIATYLAENGPVTIGIDSLSISQYKGGIVTSCAARYLNHVMLSVGYSDKDSETPYWIIKNSWGTVWGEAGYIRIQKGSNRCLIKNYAVAVLLADKSV